MSPRGYFTALATCPWCPWKAEVREPTREAVIERGRALIDEHNAEAGHRVRSGAKPRIGYYRGDPIA